MNPDEKLVARTRKNKSFGNVIQECRQRNGWTQEELGWRTDITREHVGRIERDKCIPSVATIQKLEQAFHLPEMTLVKEIMNAEEQTQSGSVEEEGVGRVCQELGHALAANLTKADLMRVRDAIRTFTDVLNNNDQGKNNTFMSQK